MTGLLKDLMHDHADSLGTPDLDLTAIRRDAEGRLRRRRTAWAGSLVAAAVLAVLAGATLLPGEGSNDQRDMVADGTDAAPLSLSWVTGDTLHRAGQPDVDLGVEPVAWAWAGGAVALVDADRRVLLAREGGAAEHLGVAVAPATDDAWVVTDRDLVAWVDEDEGYTVADTATGERLTLTDVRAGDGQRPRFTALDGAVAYAVDARGVFSWNTATGAVEVLDDDPGHVVFDAENGTIVHKVAGDRAGKVTGPGRDLTLTVDSVANLSPSGDFVMAESNDEGILLDTATGTRLELSTGHAWALPYQWLDGDTVAVLALDGIDRAEGQRRAFLQTCEMATGECAGPGIEVPSELGSFQLPIGVHFSE